LHQDRFLVEEVIIGQGDEFGDPSFDIVLGRASCLGLDEPVGVVEQRTVLRIDGSVTHFVVLAPDDLEQLAAWRLAILWRLPRHFGLDAVSASGFGPIQRRVGTMQPLIPAIG